MPIIPQCLFPTRVTFFLRRAFAGLLPRLFPSPSPTRPLTPYPVIPLHEAITWKPVCQEALLTFSAPRLPLQLFSKPPWFPWWITTRLVYILPFVVLALVIFWSYPALPNTFFIPPVSPFPFKPVLSSHGDAASFTHVPSHQYPLAISLSS